MPDVLPTRPVLLNAGKIAKQMQVEEERGQKTDDGSLRLSNRISNPGHRSYPIDCQVTEDGLGIFTLARGEGKLWNR